MLFNSIDFAIFLPIVFVLYWFVTQRNLRLQNLLIVISSCIFYGWWDWRFLFLLLFSTVTDYWVGRGFEAIQDPLPRKLFMTASLAVNLGLLGFFKYYNFFAESFATAFTWFGHEIHADLLRVVLPVGISFYTFQTLSYTIDVYRGHLKATRDPIAFAAYVMFFPQLVAGPIERATHLLPQFYVPRTFDQTKAVDGLRQILWGLFKKIVIADNCAVHANQIFNHSDQYGGSTLVLGALFFTFQIYCDFGGYSDIAIGTARLFGFQLMRNFAFPYFSRDMAEFWRRWHISLSTWFRDYVYLPLGGSRVGRWTQVRNTFIIFMLSGFWHGANWTFILWGALNALYFLPLLLTGRNRVHLDIVARGRLFPTPGELLSIGVTFTLTILAWIFFRAQSATHAFHYLGTIFSRSLFTVPRFEARADAVFVLGLCAVLLTAEWFAREQQHALERVGLRWPRPVRWALYYGLVFVIFYYSGPQQQFIYFQF